MNSELTRKCEDLATIIQQISNCKTVAQLAELLPQSGDSSAKVQNLFDNNVMASFSIILCDKIAALLSDINEDVSQEREQHLVLLSIQQLRVVYTALELLWLWALLPFVSSQCDFVLEQEPPSKSLLITQSDLGIMAQWGEPLKMQHAEDVAATATSCVYRCISNPMFSTMINRNIRRLLFSLLLLRRMAPPTSSCRKIAREAQESIDNLISSREMRVVVLSNMPVFLTSQGWLKQESSALLTRIIMSEDGLLTLFQALMDDYHDNVRNAALQSHVSTLVTSTPDSLPKEEYFSNVCGQMANIILELAPKKKFPHFLRVCTMIVSKVSSICPAICDQMLMKTLFQGLLKIDLEVWGRVSAGLESNVVDESTLLSELTTIAVLTSSFPVTKSLWMSLWRTGVIRCSFALYTHLLSFGIPRSELFEPAEQFCQQFFSCCPSQSLLLVEFHLYYIAPSSLTTSSAGTKISFGGICSDIKPIVFEESQSAPEMPLTTISELVNYAKEKEVSTKTDHLMFCKKEEDKSHASVVDTFARAGEQAKYNSVHQPVNMAALVADIHHEATLITEVVARFFDSHRRSPKPAESTALTLWSSMYVLALKSYFLGNDTDEAEFDKVRKRAVMDKTNCAAVWTPRFPSNAIARKIMGGVFVVLLQERFPLESLLSNRVEILNTLLIVIKSHAEILESKVLVKGEQDMPSLLISDRRGNETSKPLISEVLHEDSVPSASNDTNNDDEDLLGAALDILANLLQFEGNDWNSAEKAILRSLRPFLHTIGLREPAAKVAQSAVDIGMMIINVILKPPDLPRETSLHSQSTDKLSFCSKIQAIMDEHLMSESPAIRGYGVHQIRIAVTEAIENHGKAQSLTLDEVKFAADSLLIVLSDKESFVYLAALLVLRLLAQRHLIEILVLLLAYYSGDRESLFVEICSNGLVRIPVIVARGKHRKLWENLPLQSLRTRSMIGEVLVTIISIHHGTPAMNPVLSAVILSCVKLARTRQHIDVKGSEQWSVDMKKLRIREVQSFLGDASTKAELSHADAKLVESIAADADSLVLRMSALSVLAECMVHASIAVQATHFRSVLDVAGGILFFEQEKNESSQASRRSAIFLVYHTAVMICGNVCRSAEEDEMLTICLRIVQRILASSWETDSIVRFQAERAKDLLDQTARSFFPLEHNARTLFDLNVTY